jgi:hypothetical protein
MFAGNRLTKAQRILERFITKRPRSRLTIRQRTRVLQECGIRSHYQLPNHLPTLFYSATTSA